MKDHYKRNAQFYIMLLVWMVSGIVSNYLAFVVVGVSLILLKRREYDKEIFLGFIFILILSDRLDPQLAFAKSLKNLYIVLFSGFFFMDLDSFKPLNRLFNKFLPFFLFAIFCLVFSPALPVAIQKTASYILLFISVPNYVQKLFRKHGDEFLLDFLMLTFTFFTLAFALIFIDRELVYLVGRYNGPLGNPNGLGLFSFSIFVLSRVILELRGPIFSKRAWQVFNVALLFSLIMCGSRNAVVAVLLFTILSHFYKMSPFLGVIIFVIMLFLTELIGNNTEAIITSLGLQKYFRLETLKEGSGRFIAWKFAWNHIQEHFFIGRGFGYDEYYMRAHYKLLTKLGHQGGVHNSFLTFWMDTGLVGVVIYLFCYIRTFFEASKITRLAVPVILSVTFTAMFESWLVGSLNPITSIFLFILTLITNSEFKSKVKPELAKS